MQKMCTEELRFSRTKNQRLAFYCAEKKKKSANDGCRTILLILQSAKMFTASGFLFFARKAKIVNFWYHKLFSS